MSRKLVKFQFLVNCPFKDCDVDGWSFHWSRGTICWKVWTRHDQIWPRQRLHCLHNLPWYVYVSIKSLSSRIDKYIHIYLLSWQSLLFSIINTWKSHIKKEFIEIYWNIYWNICLLWILLCRWKVALLWILFSLLMASVITSTIITDFHMNRQIYKCVYGYVTICLN